MERRHLTTGLVLAVVAAASFGLSGAFVKPLLEAGWSPVAAVALRALVGGLLLAPIALVQLRGDLRPVLRAWRRVLGMALVGVAGRRSCTSPPSSGSPWARRSSSSSWRRCCSWRWRGR
jgi:drug/metabolite transporter (DMT)-like permease